jgi:hypothetical protein
MKPHKAALNHIKAAKTPDDALALTSLFIGSSDAGHLNAAQSKEFLQGLERVFLKHSAPAHYGAALTTAITPIIAKPSTDLHHFALFALTDFNSVRAYAEDVAEVISRNAKILKGLKESPSSGFSFATHYGSESKEPSKLNYVGLSYAQNADDLKSAINNILLEQDIPDQKADGFLRAVNGSFRRLNISADDRVELLSFIQDGTKADSSLHDLAIKEANRITQNTQGPVPNSAHNLGRDLH